MEVLLKLRDTVLGLLEQARSQKYVLLKEEEKVVAMCANSIVRNLRSSLEAEVDIIIADSDQMNQGHSIATILQRHSRSVISFHVLNLMSASEKFLKTLFIVSDVSFLGGDTTGSHDNEWVYSSSLDLPCTQPDGHQSQGIAIPGTHTDDTLVVRVRPSTRAKCPRCWTYTRPEENELCDRCTDALS